MPVVQTPIVSDQTFTLAQPGVTVISEQSTRRLTESGQIRYFCPQCNVRYVHFKYLKTHLRDCGNEFRCDICSNVFKQRRTFVVHMKEKHGTHVKIGAVMPTPMMTSKNKKPARNVETVKFEQMEDENQ